MNPPSMAIADDQTSPSVTMENSSVRDLPKISAFAALQLGRRQAQRDLQSSLPLLVLDAISVATALLLASFASRWLTESSVFAEPMIAAGVVALTILFQHIHGLYPACGLSYSIEHRRISQTCLMVCTALALGLLMRAEGAFPIFEWSIFAVLLLVLMSSVRALARHQLGRYDWWAQPVIIVGSSTKAVMLHDRLEKCRHEGLRPLGLVFEPAEHWTADQELSKRYLGPLVELDSLLTETGTCRVAVAEADRFHWQDYQSFHGIPHVMLPTDLGAHPCERAQLLERDGAIELHCHSALTSPGSLIAKRVLDLTLLAITLPFWLPLMVGIGLLMKIMDPGPIFYRQDRIGRFRRPFRAIKFRSMVCDADQKLKEYLETHPGLRAEWERTHKLQNDPRVTTLGGFLRKSSLDELPQIINVLRGEMSLVGPRPIIDGGDYDYEYIQEHPEVFELYQFVRPGITGLWQVSGRNSLPYKQRIYLDRFYLHNWTLSLDIFILWRTLKTAIFREGAY